MEAIEKIRLTVPLSWGSTVASLLPLWLLSIAITAEGGGSPPVSGELARISFALAIAASIVFLWNRWMVLEVFFYSLAPILLLVIFDEISTTYKTPFILLCVLILTAGIIAYERKRGAPWSMYLLLFVGVVAIFAALHASGNYWEWVGDLGYGNCFPDASDCAPLTGQETPWWVLFFSL